MAPLCFLLEVCQFYGTRIYLHIFFYHLMNYIHTHVLPEKKPLCQRAANLKWLNVWLMGSSAPFLLNCIVFFPSGLPLINLLKIVLIPQKPVILISTIRHDAWDSSLVFRVTSSCLLQQFTVERTVYVTPYLFSLHTTEQTAQTHTLMSHKSFFCFFYISFKFTNCLNFWEAKIWICPSLSLWRLLEHFLWVSLHFPSNMFSSRHAILKHALWIYFRKLFFIFALETFILCLYFLSWIFILLFILFNVISFLWYFLNLILYLAHTLD